MVTVYIPAALRKFSGDREKVDLELEGGGSLRRVIELLDKECPGIKEPLMFEGGIHPSIAVFINDEQAAAGIIERVPEDATIRLLPAMGGGAGSAPQA
ncbi:MAG TPA: MoaD/ThiS family protein [Dehalococcoidia bacterium]|nr:MoaD/ThiS family protein [Dehalococcoidia bacterium]